MDILTFSQIFFNFIASIAIIVVGALLAISLFYFLKTAKSISEVTEKLNIASAEIKSNVSAFFDKLYDLPIFKFMKKKGRKNNETKIKQNG